MTMSLQFLAQETIGGGVSLVWIEAPRFLKANAFRKGQRRIYVYFFWRRELRGR